LALKRFAGSPLPFLVLFSLRRGAFFEIKRNKIALRNKIAPKEEDLFRG
jgi:hypothetical protein